MGMKIKVAALVIFLAIAYIFAMPIIYGAHIIDINSFEDSIYLYMGLGAVAAVCAAIFTPGRK